MKLPRVPLQMEILFRSTETAVGASWKKYYYSPESPRHDLFMLGTGVILIEMLKVGIALPFIGLPSSVVAIMKLGLTMFQVLGGVLAVAALIKLIFKGD